MASADSSAPIIHYPPGFRRRRGLNWVVLGAMYASFYMLRYNFRWAAPGMEHEFGFSHASIAKILSASYLAYGTGQLVNGLLCDRIGGRISMLIGAVGTIAMNLIFGFASFTGTLSTFALIWLMNGYFQSFGAPGMVKINAAWFNRTERGTFAGIFGFMIQLGQVAIGVVAPIILAGFTIGTLLVAKDDWRWLFRLPPIVTAIIAVLVAIIPKETPEQAGYHGCIKDESDVGGEHSEDVRVDIKTSFLTVFRHPLVWFYALAYACTGVVRQSSDQFAVLFFAKYLHFNPAAFPTFVGLTLAYIAPLTAVAGSFISGVVSDKVFHGHRSPVAMGLYFMTAIVCAIAAITMLMGLMQPTDLGIVLSCVFLILTSFAVNATHSLVGTAAPMDIGGRKMAGFASGVIDSFQYYGPAIVLPIVGWSIDRYGWATWYPTMILFGAIGGCAMLLVMRKQKRMSASSPAAAV
jgi:OPA family glycerol-3-phosphate transporter-like MFS transporter